MLEAWKKKLSEIPYQRPGVSLPKRAIPFGQQVKEIKSRLTPSFVPLLIGFTVLLIVVFLLGVLSEAEISSVQRDIAELELRQGEKTKLFFDVSNAVDSLDSEARIRAKGKRSGELMPPSEIRLDNAREKLRETFPRFKGVTFLKEENWLVLQQSLEKFVAATKDLNTYEENGFVQVREIKKQLESLKGEIDASQIEKNKESIILKNNAMYRIKILRLMALGIGLVVVVVTLWEVQRRFKQTQRSEETARRERHFNEQMMEGMVTAVAAVDSKGTIRSANAPFLEIFSDIEIGGELQASENMEIKARLVTAASATPVVATAYRGRWKLDELKTKYGVSRTFDLYVSPLEIDDETGYIITLVDVTEAVEAESELRRKASLAAMGQATAQVAHEIRNPLGSIRLGVSMLREMTNAKEAISTIDLVDRGIDHLQKLVVDVTQFSRQRALKLSEVDIHLLMAESLELVANNINEKQTSVEKFYSNETLMGEYDEDQLRQVFVNLLANAIDASDVNSPIAITTRRVEHETEDIFASASDGITPTIKKPFVQIVITDNGCGMDEETKARIFEPFYSTKAKGTGLGLAIVKQIVENHEGTIEIKSEINIGTSFTIELPLKNDHESYDVERCK
jgi:signal transduction histidine kinase/cell division protein FtsL